MIPGLKDAFIIGLERVTAWSDVLDRINVFPVADGDTGRNLVISLTPLRFLQGDQNDTIHRLLLSARGNSGNIAVRFVSELAAADSPELLPGAAGVGRDRAWQAVHDPRPGTMLSVFDAMVAFMEENGFDRTREYVSRMIDHLERAVLSTPELLPRLKAAGVVDSGALGMFIFMEGFLRGLAGQTDGFRSITSTFRDMLEVSPSFQEETQAGYCVDTVLKSDDHTGETIDMLSRDCESVVVIPHEDYLKVHLHTRDSREARHRIDSLGDVLQWSDDDIGTQIEDFRRPVTSGAVHIMTDAAGSVTRQDSRKLGMTLLASYIIAGDRSLPETLFSPGELYRHMRKGVRVTTTQASVFERHQCYQSVLSRYPRVLYLCVGSVYTGNYDVALEWKRKNDADNRLTVIDTGAASGRLGTLVHATARYATGTDDPGAVIEFARKALHKCREYVFLDTLKFLAAGGRLSRSGAFLGDMLHVKPIISPTAEGAVKVGSARNREKQLEFALDRLEESLGRDASPLVMLEYSDNPDWVEGVVAERVRGLHPRAEVLLQPLSLTSGVHMGPGTWGVAFLSEDAWDVG